MRRYIRLAGAATAASVVLVLGGCSGGESDSSAIPVAEDAADYCKRLAMLPDGLQDAVRNPKSSDSRITISRTAVHLGTEADNKSVPADLRRILRRASAVLDKVQAGKQVSEAEAKSLLSLEEEVKKACSG